MILFRLLTHRTPTQFQLWQLYRLQRNQARTGWGGWLVRGNDESGGMEENDRTL